MFVLFFDSAPSLYPGPCDYTGFTHGIQGHLSSQYVTFTTTPYLLGDIYNLFRLLKQDIGILGGPVTPEVLCKSIHLGQHTVSSRFSFYFLIVDCIKDIRELEMSLIKIY